MEQGKGKLLEGVCRERVCHMEEFLEAIRELTQLQNDQAKSVIEGGGSSEYRDSCAAEVLEIGEIRGHMGDTIRCFLLPQLHFRRLLLSMHFAGRLS